MSQLKYISLMSMARYGGQLIDEELVKWIEENVKDPYKGYAKWGADRSLYLTGIELDPEQELVFKLKFGI